MAKSNTSFIHNESKPSRLWIILVRHATTSIRILYSRPMSMKEKCKSTVVLNLQFSSYIGKFQVTQVKFLGFTCLQCALPQDCFPLTLDVKLQPKTNKSKKVEVDITTRMVEPFCLLFLQLSRTTFFQCLNGEICDGPLPFAPFCVLDWYFNVIMYTNFV